MQIRWIRHETSSRQTPYVVLPLGVALEQPPETVPAEPPDIPLRSFLSAPTIADLASHPIKEGNVKEGIFTLALLAGIYAVTGVKRIPIHIERPAAFLRGVFVVPCKSHRMERILNRLRLSGFLDNRTSKLTGQSRSPVVEDDGPIEERQAQHKKDPPGRP
jgi:hypothetical protein